MFTLTYIILVVISAQKVFGQDVTVTLDKTCYGGTGESMTMTASYSGSFAIIGVIWSYSGRNTQDIIVDTSCSVFQADTGFPNNRISYVCPPNTTNSNTYQLILSTLGTDDLNSETWGATFQLSAPSNPAFETVQPKICEATSAVSSTSTTTTTPTTTTTTPTKTTTTPTTTSISISTSTTSTQSSPSSSSNSTTKISTVVTTTKPTTTTSYSNETTVIIISSVVGGLFLIGIVITIVLMLLSQRRGHNQARRHCDRRQKRRDNHRYPSWQDHGQYNNASYMEYSGMGTKMNPLYVPNRSAHRPEQNYYLGHPSTDQQIYTRNHQISYGGHYNNVRPQTDMHFNQPRYYGRRGCNNISSTLHRDENNYVAPDYELYW